MLYFHGRSTLAASRVTRLRYLEEYLRPESKAAVDAVPRESTRGLTLMVELARYRRKPGYPPYPVRCRVILLNEFVDQQPHRPANPGRRGASMSLAAPLTNGCFLYR